MSQKSMLERLIDVSLKAEQQATPAVRVTFHPHCFAQVKNLLQLDHWQVIRLDDTTYAALHHVIGERRWDRLPDRQVVVLLPPSFSERSFAAHIHRGVTDVEMVS